MVGFSVVLPGGALAEVPLSGANATLNLNGSNTYSDQTYTGSMSVYHNTSTYGYFITAASLTKSDPDPNKAKATATARRSTASC
jgi:hypothetical protein